MAEAQLAQPYAAAVFELAEAEDRFQEWSDMLGLLARIVADERVARLLRAPRLSPEERADVLLAIAGDHLDDRARNLVRLMATNRRLPLLPQVAEQYEALRAREERRIDVRVTSATELTDEQRERIAGSLHRRLGREVRLHPDVDASLIAGAVVRAGDLVIDGSLRGRLQRLASRLAR